MEGYRAKEYLARTHRRFHVDRLSESDLRVRAAQWTRTASTRNRRTVQRAVVSISLRHIYKEREEKVNGQKRTGEIPAFEAFIYMLRVRILPRITSQELKRRRNSSGKSEKGVGKSKVPRTKDPEIPAKTTQADFLAAGLARLVTYVRLSGQGEELGEEIQYRLRYATRKENGDAKRLR